MDTVRKINSTGNTVRKAKSVDNTVKKTKDKGYNTNVQEKVQKQRLGMPKVKDTQLEKLLLKETVNTVRTTKGKENPIR
jgi:hypothetical protein